MGRFSVPLLLAIMSVFNPYPQRGLRYCLHIFIYHMSPSDGYITTSIFSQYFKGLSINLNSNWEDSSRKKLSTTKTGGIKTHNEHICLQKLPRIQFFKDSLFISENSKNALVTKQHSLLLWSLPRISHCFLVSNSVMQHFLACLCKAKRISQGGFLGYDIPNRL